MNPLSLRLLCATCALSLSSLAFASDLIPFENQSGFPIPMGLEFGLDKQATIRDRGVELASSSPVGHTSLQVLMPVRELGLGVSSQLYFRGLLQNSLGSAESGWSSDGRVSKFTMLSNSEDVGVRFLLHDSCGKDGVRDPKESHHQWELEIGYSRWSPGEALRTALPGSPSGASLGTSQEVRAELSYEYRAEKKDKGWRHPNVIPWLIVAHDWDAPGGGATYAELGAWLEWELNSMWSIRPAVAVSGTPDGYYENQTGLKGVDWGLVRAGCELAFRMPGGPGRNELFLDVSTWWTNPDGRFTSSGENHRTVVGGGLRLVF